MKRLLHEPLLHFLLLGAVLFGLYGWLNREGFTGPNEIVVSRGQVSGLQAQFERVWQRAPTQPELQGLIDSWVRDEIFYREALAMGLDRDDPIVRRRMSQKIEFIVEGATPAAPTIGELQQWLDEHADAYRTEPSYELQQLYFDPAQHGPRLEEVVARSLRKLAAGQPVSGDPTMLPHAVQADESEIVRTFGRDFAIALQDAPLGAWHGPVRSGFGLHLVQLTAREPARTPRLDEVRASVERDLTHARSQAAKEAFYERLREGYTVTIAQTETEEPRG